MFKHIFLYELKDWLKKPAPYIYLLVFASIAFLSIIGTAGMFDPQSTSTKIERLVNSPFEVNYMLQYFGKFMMFLLPAIIGATVYMDYKNNSHSVMYSFPIKKQDYLFGKFLSALLMVFIIAIGIGVAMVIAEHIPGLHDTKIGDFNIKGYLQAFLIYILPNLLIYGAIVFAVVVYFRNIYAGFVVVLLLFLLQNITENVFDGFLIALLDPFAQNATIYETQFWTLKDQNTKLIPVIGAVLYNRFLWLLVAIVVFGFVYKTFTFSEHAISSFSKKKNRVNVAKPNIRGFKNLKLPKVDYDFSNMQQLKNAWSLSKIKFRSIIRNWMFYIIITFGILAVLFAIGKLTNNGEMTILPVTNIVLTIPAFFFATIIMLLTFIYSGMLVDKDNSSNMNQLVDATPISNFALLASKVIAIIKMQAVLLLIMMVSGILIQIYNGYYDFEIGLYLFHLFIVQFISLIIWAFASIFIHSLIKNTYLGIFVLIIGWLSISGIKEAGINTRLLLFNFSEPMQYSDLNGYANHLLPLFVVKSYWLVFATLLLLISYLLWTRGLPESFKQRLVEGKSNLNGKARTAFSILIVGFLVLGFTIYSEENKSQELPDDERNTAFNQFESDYNKYSKIENQPKIINIDLEIDIFPESNKLDIKGLYTLVNKSEVPIDTLLVKTGFDEITTLNLDVASEVIDEDTYVKFSVLKLKKALFPNDSLKLEFILKNKPNNLFENNSNILNNGTFFKNDILPRIGYFLNSNQKNPTDSTAYSTHYYSQDSDFISLKTVISTSANQTAIAPGYLKTQWKINDRNYFEYETKDKIKNSLSFSSGEFEKNIENYNGVKLEVYHHKKHMHNVTKMKDGLKAALDYNTKYFGLYQFNETRIVEFPITEGTFASVMANSIPTSEMRFIANSSDEVIDISFYTIAHELTHQWWGNQVVPANAFGATMLSESITEYISLNIYEQAYGIEKAQDFLKMQHSRYLSGRVRETNIESPLFMAKGDQQYIAYGKGTIAFNTLSHYLGKEKFHNILKKFLNTYGNKEAPYPTTINFLNLLKANTPDSHKYIVADYFETVTFHESKINSVNINKTENNEYEVIVDFEFSKFRNNDENNELPLNDYLEVGLYNDKNELITIKTVLVNSINNSNIFRLKEKVSKIILDPNLLLIEKNVKNNKLNL